MLKAHMDAKENELVASSRVAANAGHSIHKGTPREIFIRNFLESHLPASMAIGTGEIIDARSKPNVPRNQYDIVIYKKNYPKLDFGGNISGFLVESVVATVEIKSTLSEPDLYQAIKAARNAKQLVPNLTTSFYSGYIPPSILNYVVAYDGPSNMSTVYSWIPKIHANLGISVADLPLDAQARQQTASPSIDGVFVMNKGFLYFDNAPIGFNNNQGSAPIQGLKWLFANTQTGNLLLLFLFLQNAVTNVEGRWLQVAPYLSTYAVENIQMGE